MRPGRVFDVVGTWSLGRVYLSLGALALVTCLAGAGIHLVSASEEPAAPPPGADRSITVGLADQLEPADPSPSPSQAASPQQVPEAPKLPLVGHEPSGDSVPPSGGVTGITCAALSDLYLNPGKSVQAECSVGANHGFSGTIALSCSAPGGMTCEVTPNEVSPRNPVPGDPGSVAVAVKITALPETGAFDMQKVVLTGSVAGSNSRFHQSQSQISVMVEKPNYMVSCNFPPGVGGNPGSSDSGDCYVMQFDSAFQAPLYLSINVEDAGAPQAVLSTSTVSVLNGVANFSINILIGPTVAPGDYHYEVGITHIQGGPPLPQAFGSLPPTPRVRVTVTAPTPTTAPSGL
jgi:hypothetical protein